MRWTILFACSLGAVSATAIAQTYQPVLTQSGWIGYPERGKAQVVFWRPGSIMGMALGCTVHEGESEVARLGSGKHFVVNVEPGKHVYSTHGQAADALNLEVEADETYFVKCKIGTGVVTGGAQLEPSDRESFAKRAKGSILWRPATSR